MKKNILLYILTLGLLFLLSGCLTYTVAAEKIEIDETTVPSEITVDDFKLSDIKLIVTRVDGKVDVISLREDMISDSDLSKLNRSGYHSIYIQYDGKLAFLAINLLESYPEVEVYFETNGGSNVSRQVIEKNTKAHRPSNPKKEGYVFDGWYKDRDYIEPFSFSEKIVEDITLYAKWAAISNIVTFETNGGSKIEYVSVNTGDALEEIAAPVRKGYDFLGWYVDEELTIKYDFSKAVEESFTLYAKWDAHKYVVSFNSNGGTAIDSLEVYHNEKVDKPVDPLRKGYQLEGWYVDKELTIKYDFDMIVENSMILYAKWETAYFTVEFESFGGTLVSTQKVEYGKKLEKVSSTKERYEFLGWYTDSEFKNLFDFDSFVLEDMTLYAKWKGEDVLVDFETNGGTYIESVIGEYGKPLNKVTAPKKDGYIFMGWYKDSKFTSYFSFSEKLTGDLTLYAKWNQDTSSELQYSVVLFNQDLEIIDTIKVSANSNLLGMVVPSFPNKVLQNWYTDSSFGAVYDLSMPITRNISIYGLYVDGYEVTFLDKDGNFIAKVLAGEGMKADAPDAPVVEGYEFIGWSQSIDNITGPITVKARYDLKKFKVDFISDGKVVHTQMVKTGELPVIPDDLNKYAKEGYHFAGFNKEITSVTGNVSYTIDWDLNEYIVSFVDYYNQVLAEVKVYHGERIPKYVFSGDDYYGENENWYTTNSFINLYNFNTPIKDNLTLYGQFDFNSSILYSIVNGEVVISSLNAKGLTTLSIPKYLNKYKVVSVLEIINGENVKSLVIPNTINNLKIEELQKLSSLENIDVEKNSLLYSSIDGVLCDKDENEILLYPPCKNELEYSAPTTIHKIGNLAFSNTKKLLKVKLNNIEELGKEIFKNSSVLSVEIDKLNISKVSDTFNYVNESFKILVAKDYYNSYLSSWSDIKTMIYSLENVYQGYLYQKTDEGIIIVEYLGNETNIVIPSIIDGAEVVGISEYAFNSLFSVKGIEIPSGIKNIQDNAFNNLNLRYIKINDELNVSEGYLLKLSEMLKNTYVYVNEDLYGEYQVLFNNLYLLDNIEGDFSFISKNGMWGVLQYLGDLDEIVVPQSFNQKSISFIEQGFIENSNVVMVNIPFYIYIETGAINREIVVVPKELLEEYELAYPNIAFYSDDTEIVVDRRYIYGIVNGEIIIIKLNDYSDSVIIPDYIESKKVVSIGRYALSNCLNLRVISIGSEIKLLEKDSLKTLTESEITIVFNGNIAPDVNGEVCYLTDKVYKKDIDAKEYGFRFPNHSVLTYNSKVKENDEYQYEIQGEKVSILKYLSNAIEVTIPETIEGFKVVSIAPYAFSNKITVRKVNISKNVESVGYKAFDSMRNLTEIIINSDRVIYIEKDIFSTPVVVRVPDKLLYRYQNSDKTMSIEPIGMSAEIVTSGDCRYVIDNGKAIILSIDCYEKSNVVSYKIDGYEIKKIGAFALYDTDIKDLLVLGNIEKIGYNGLPKGLTSLNVGNMKVPILSHQSCEFVVTADSSEVENYKKADGWSQYKVVISSLTFGKNLDFEYYESKEGIEISKYIGTEKVVRIPDEINGKPVVKIGNFAFVNSKITSVEFGKNVKIIGEKAFYNSKDLEIISGTDQIEHVYAYAFHNTRWYSDQFQSMIIIGKVFYRFNDTFSLEREITIGEGIVSISPYAFGNCLGISEVNLPNSLLEIGKGAFNNCQNLLEISLPLNIEIIEDETFSNCYRLKKVSFDKNVYMIGEKAFNNCGLLKEISSLENVQYIKNQAFDGCSVLSLINLPVGLKELGKNVFRNCLVLEISIDSKNALYHIENGVLYNKEKTILIEDLLKEKEREIEVLSSVTEIKDNAFNGSNVKKVIIKSFIKFGNNVFKDNDSLEGIVIDYNKLPSLLEDSISYGTKLYLLNGLIELVNEDYIFENYYIEGIIEFELDLIKAKVGEEIEVKINTPYEYKNENLIFRSSDNSIVKVENGKIIANSKGTVQLTVTLFLGKSYTDVITIIVE